MQVAAITKPQDVERVVVRADAVDPVRNVVRINEYASNPAAKDEKHPKKKCPSSLITITKTVRGSIMRHVPALVESV